MEENRRGPTGEDGAQGGISPVQSADLSSLSEQDISAIKDDLVRAVVERAKLVEGDAHSSHSNVHSSNSAGAL